MISKISIWNQALSRLGESALSSPDEATHVAAICKTHYESCVENVLRLHGWNCARKRAALARLADAPAFGWSYAYALPTDYVLLLEADPNVPYLIESGNLLCNAEAMNILYIRNVKNEAEFSPGLVQCVVLLLASRIAPQLNQEGGSAILGELYQTELPLARAADAYENRGGLEPPRESWTGPGGDCAWL